MNKTCFYDKILCLNKCGEYLQWEQIQFMRVKRYINNILCFSTYCPKCKEFNYFDADILNNKGKFVKVLYDE